METSGKYTARKWIALALLAAFVIGTIPMTAVSARLNDVPATETIDNSVVGQTVEASNNNIITDNNQASPDVPSGVAQPDHAADSERADHSRPEWVQGDAEAPHEHTADNHAQGIADRRTPAARPEKVRNERPVASSPDKRPVQTMPSVMPITPNYTPMPPTPAWTTVSGNVLTQTWTLAGSPYFITGDVTIPVGNTLTINPGVQVLFNGSYAFTVYGTMNAVGTAASHISFNTNFAGSWDRINFFNNGAGTLMYVSINGSVNAVRFLNANNTVEIGFCDITNTTGYGIWMNGASVCGINIHDNYFNTGSYAYYENVVFLNPGSVSIGSRIFTQNNITSNYGYYSQNFEFDTPNPGANIVVGQTTITWNKMPNLDIAYYYVHHMIYGSVNWGDVIITDNTINNTAHDYALDFYGWLDELTDVTANIGDVTVLRNNVKSSGVNHYGIHIDYWDVEGLYGTTAVNLQTCHVNDNTVNTTGGEIAIFTYYDCMDDLHDYSYINSPGAEMIGNTVLDSGSDGVYMYSAVGYDMYGYSSMDVGNFVIDDNIVLDAGEYGIYQYAYECGYEMYDDSRFVMGDIITTDNNVTSNNDALELYIYEMGEYMYQNAYASFGQIYTSNNTFNSSNGDGGYIYVDYMGSYMFGNTQAWFGDFICMYNDFISTSGDYALYVDDIEDIGYELYANAQVHYGDILLNWNNIDAWHNGFYFSFYGCVGYYIYDNSFCEVGDFEINHNTIVAVRDAAYNDAYGFFVASDYVGYEMWGASQVMIGHMEFNDNDVTILHGVDSDGIYFSNIYEYAEYMYGTASFTMTGNLEVCRNTVNATVGYYGIYADFYDMAYYLYGNNYAEFQDFLLNDNQVSAGGYSIYSYLGYLGYYIYGNCNASFGNSELNNNTVWSDGDYGIYSDWEYLASETYGDQMIVDFGEFRQNDNLINATSGASTIGWYCYLEYWAYDVYEGTAIVHFGNYEFMRNTINSTGDAVYFYWNEMAAETYGSCELYFGDFTVSDNHVNSTGDSGIYWGYYLYEFAYDVYDDSFVEFGNFYCMDNDVVSNDYGIYADSEYTLGDYLEDNSISRIGDIVWTGNTVNNSGTNDGIYFYMYEVGYDNANTAQGYLGDVHVDNNNISSGGDGIYFEYYEVGYDLEDESIFVMGDTTINDNTIDTQWYGGGNGIYMDGLDEVGHSLTENAYFEMGKVEIARNTITSNSDGIYWYEFTEIAYGLEDNAQVRIGDIFVTGNNMSCDNYGIYLDDWYYVGYDTDHSSYMEMGDIKFNNNTIRSNSECIYFDELYDWGYDLYDNSVFTMGNFELCNNYLNSSNEDGIYFSTFNYFASGMEDNAYFEIGDWLLNDNTIICDGYGMYFYTDYFAYDNDDSSVAMFGDNEIMRNDIIATDDGIQSWWLYDSGYDLYDDSYAEFGDCFVMYNTINTTGGYGIYLGPYDFGYNVYDTTDAIAGDYIVSFNDIISTDEGIYFYDYYVGYNLDGSSFSYSTSTVTLGDIEVNDNTIYSDNDYGINFECEYLGYEVDHGSRVTTGSIEVNNNDITGFDGIYFYYYCIGYDVYNDAIVTIGTLDISYNTIEVDSNNEGIYFESDYLAYDIEDFSKLYMGDILIHDNDILSAQDGIRIDNDDSQDVYDYTYTEVAGMKVYNNNINCSEYGLHLNYYSDTDVDATATSVWPAWEIYDNSITNATWGIFAESDANAPMPTWDIHDMDFKGFGATGKYGVYVINVHQFLVYDCTFDNYDCGIRAQTNTELRMASCTLTNMDIDDVYLETNSNVFMIDCAFDESDVTYIDAPSTLDVGWYLNVTVQTPLGNRVPEADLQAISNGGMYIENIQTNANGQAVMMLRDKQFNQANPWPTWNFNYSNHNVTASKSINTGWAKPEVTMMSSKAITIILGDSLPPTVAGGDYSDKVATTGDPFTMRAGASDDMGVLSVRVDYRIAGGAWQWGAMTYNGALWTFATVMPSNLLGNVDFYFTARDIGGNPSPVSVTRSVAIMDNDAPVIVDNSLPAVSPMYHFNFTATDNIALSGVYINYWLTGNPVTNLSMGIGGVYDQALVVPYLPASSLNYYLSAVDTSGNWMTTNLTSMSIIDITAPWLISDNSSANATTGDQFNFQVTVIDNYNIVIGVNAVYWFGIGPETNLTLNIVLDNYTGTITVPANTTGPLNYKIVASDPAGNWLVGNITAVTVTDNDAPTIVSDNSDMTATTGDAFRYNFTATDNIALANGILVYWFDSGALHNITLDASGAYSGTIAVPINAAVLRYYVTLSDTHGNTVTMPVHNITVTDNDSPAVGTDSTQSTAGPGAAFTFSVTAADNIGITAARVIYWFGSGAIYTQALNGTLEYSAAITTPAGSFDDLHYYFTFEDAAGNTAQTSEKVVRIVDTVQPTLGADTSDTSATEYSEFTFRVAATDEGGIKVVYAVYWTDGNQPYYALLILENGIYTGTISVPEGSELHYYFVAEDMSGNSVQGAQIDLAIAQGEAESPGAEIAWLYIVIIVILIVVILVLLVTRGKGNAPAPAGPAPNEQPAGETGQDAPAEEETEVIQQ